ncbi:MAG TPA: hypothetical protein VGT99_11790 [Gammaproteobacteria bacterium]|nr:hypothetical protein [Gammaproteobacteria bacterium]
MKRVYLSCILLASAILWVSAAAADKPADVRDVMTANQFRNAGLDKLTAEQMTALNADIANISVQAAADRPADLENILTARQYRDAGLDGLTAEQIAALNAWLTGYLRSRSQAAAAPAAPAAAAPAAATPAPAAATGTAAFGAPMLKSTVDEPDSIRTAIVGKFTGWSGNTVFKLANGQVWQQSDAGDYETQMQDPEVVIKKLRFGYLLTIPGSGQTVFVMRIH